MVFEIAAEDLDGVLGHTREVWTQLRGSRIFLTGGTGFFGRWLLASLLWANRRLDAGVRAVVMTRDPAGFLARFPEAGDPCLTLHPGDLRYSVLPAGHFSHIVHAATDSKFDQPAEHFQIMDGIVTGTRRLLDFAVHRAEARRLLFVSSGAVYGAPPADGSPIPETHPTAPSTTDPAALVGNAKRLAEQMCTLYHQQFGLEIPIARCFAFVGPHMPMDSYFAIGNFIRDACGEGEEILVKGDGTAVRSYLYAADLAIWLWRLLAAGETRAYNVGSDHAVSMKELAYFVQKQLAPTRRVRIAGENRHHSAARSVYLPDIHRARTELGLQVQTPLPLAIERTAAWHRQTREVPPTRSSRPGRRLVVDIDGVLASLTHQNDYSKAQPLTHTIQAINRLHDSGDRIVLLTARGSATGLDWRAVTERQMSDWGVRYHELHFGKPAADLYVDDRMISLEMLHALAAETQNESR
ncbi:MAG: NAD-dependent epimerase/dehydratase family protein [Magnetococcales bacterium]|nr:NAD-dependent epimerase/dehydratase family protein [Magnetococcales bacterium]